MNPAHLHLALIHFPIAAAFLALPLIGLALYRKADLGATLAAALVLGSGGLAAGLAVNTGEGAEEIVEGLPGVTEAAIHAHEEAAELAMVVSIVTGVLGVAAAGLATNGRGRLAVGTLGVALAADVVTAAAMARAGNLAGLIRHPEIADGASNLAAEGEDDGDDD